MAQRLSELLGSLNKPQQREPKDFRVALNEKVQEVLERYEKTPKVTDSEELLKVMLSAGMKELAQNPRVKFAPRVICQIRSEGIAVKFDVTELATLEVHWNGFNAR